MMSEDTINYIKQRLRWTGAFFHNRDKTYHEIFSYPEYTYDNDRILYFQNELENAKNLNLAEFQENLIETYTNEISYLKEKLENSIKEINRINSIKDEISILKNHPNIEIQNFYKHTITELNAELVNFHSAEYYNERINECVLKLESFKNLDEVENYKKERILFAKKKLAENIKYEEDRLQKWKEKVKFINDIAEIFNLEISSH